jgi:hypothetical protein
MPEARWEWIVFSLGIAITAALLVLIVLGRDPATPASRGSPTAQHATRPPTTTAPTATTTAATTTAVSALPTTTTRTPVPAPPVRLRLTARDDTWLSVRRTSSSGTVLYQGTLAAGASRTFSGERFEIRFGAAANVQATLNGKPLALPGGTYSVSVGGSGLGARSA